ncbi:MAG: sensor histidine kinase [Motiliproteus sp.]
MKGRWHHLSLSLQFVTMGAVVLIIGMIVMGFWVTRQIEQGVLNNTAASTALFMRSFIEPEVQELSFSDKLDADTRQQLDQLLQASDLSRRIISFKVWKEEGYIAYSSRPSIIGKTFPTTPNLRKAWTGVVTAEFDTLEDEEDALERATGMALLEIYSPIRQSRTGKVIAVAEFYSYADDLKGNLLDAQLRSWLVVAVVTLFMLGALSGIVVRGSRTIKMQRSDLETHVTDLRQLLSQNEELRKRLQRASRKTVETNERFLRRIGSDLHDGPAQLLAFALLRLDALRKQLGTAGLTSADLNDITVMKDSLSNALTEIRDTCTGLTLPELQELTAEQVIHSVAQSHERRTNTQVNVDINRLPQELTHPLKICSYRFIQEALNNATKHAGGKEQQVTVDYDEDTLHISVSDSGPGFCPDQQDSESGSLGLIGLHERIATLGGTMKITSTPSSGTTISMSCKIYPSQSDQPGFES